MKNIKNPGFDNEIFKETTCYLRNGEGMAVLFIKK